MSWNKSYINRNFIFLLTLILASVTNTSAVLDTTKIGINEGDVYYYKARVVSIDTEYHALDICLVCPENGTEFLVSDGDEFTLEILSITDGEANIDFINGENSVEDIFPLGVRQESMVLYTDWDYWPDSVAEEL